MNVTNRKTGNVCFLSLVTAMLTGTKADLGWDGGPVYVMGVERESGVDTRMDGVIVKCLFDSGKTCSGWYEI
jgi:hypothetical protein